MLWTCSALRPWKTPGAALAMEPATGNGIHTDAQANAILAGCYAQQGNHLQALQHADAALEIASKQPVPKQRPGDPLPCQGLAPGRPGRRHVARGPVLRTGHVPFLHGHGVFRGGRLRSAHQELRGRPGNPRHFLWGHPDHGRRGAPMPVVAVAPSPAFSSVTTPHAPAPRPPPSGSRR